MAQRLNKKLLLGLGSGIGFLTTGVISGFGIRAIANQGIDNFNQTNRLAEQAFTQAPDYNVATPNMFIDTTNLKNFHFGNTQIGQTVTPYGWLGVFEDSRTVQNRIALTSWSGEILWVNEDYKNETTDQFNVYDMKYDFNSNLIFVIRTNSPNGMFTPTGGLAPLRLDVLDAKTGKNVYNALDSNYWVSNIQARAKARFQQIFFDINNPSANDWQTSQARWKNLFYLDIASRPDSNRVVVSYIPKFTQMVQKRKLNGRVNAVTGAPEGPFVTNDQEIKLISVKEFIDSWRETVLSVQFLLDANKKPTAHLSRRYWLRKSRQINASTDDWLIGNGDVAIDMKDYFLIANPFVTISNRGNLIIHFIAANVNNDVWHKTIGFTISGGSEDNTIRNADFSQNLRGTELFTLPTEPNFVKTWGYTDRWNDLFVNANLIPNRNMFNSNSIVVAYPYASSENALPNRGRGLPAFNVQQLAINENEDSGVLLIASSRDSRDPKQSWNYTFGKDIADNYNLMGGSFYPNGSVNSPFPWPLGQNINITSANIDRQYNRLLTVSPFDNTVVYAAKANLNLPELVIGEGNREKSVGLWIANRNSYNLNQGQRRFARPFLIPNWNQGDAASLIDLQMTNPKSLYTDGVTFDILSLQSQNNGTAKLNLYFNQTGAGRNDLYNNNGLRTSKIGLLEDVLTRDANLWTDNIANLATISGTDTDKIKKISSKITNDSFATLIHSRANLQTWFARTWLNNTNPANLYTNNYQLNLSENSNSRAVATRFNQALTGAEFSRQDSVDLVSHWQAPNYNRLVVKRPKIIVNGSVTNKLPIQTTYSLINNGNDLFNKPGWGISSNQRDRVTYQTNQEIDNASYQIFSSWKNQVRLNSIGSNTTISTSNLNIRESHTIAGNPQWFDARQAGAINAPFGKINNELPVNQFNPLRVLLKIVKPEGNLPAWFNGINASRFFDTMYPLAKDALPGETTFQEILPLFFDEKARRIDLSQDNGAAIGLGNLVVEAYLDVNPVVISGPTNNNGKIFTNGKKRILALNNGQRLIYDDQYNGLRKIYDQNAINYDDFNQYGFGNAVRASVQESWQGNTLPAANQKILVEANAANLPNDLVRKSTTDERLFTFKYKDNDPSKLVLNPFDAPWLKSRLLNFQRLLGMQVQFQFKQPGGSWQVLTTTTDAKLKTYWQADDTVELPTSGVQNINELRIVLLPMRANDANNFVQLNNFSSTDTKYISAPQAPLTQKIKVDPAWFNQVTLTSANNATLDQLSTNDLTNYENQLKTLLRTANQNSDQLANQVELRYTFGNQTNLNAADLVAAIKRALEDLNRNDKGIFTLWNGTKGLKIKAIWQLKPTAGADYVLVNSQNNPITNDAQRSGDLLSTIATKIDLSPYFNQLQAQPLQALKDTQNGRLQSFTMPDATSGRLNGLTYEQIKAILSVVGLNFQFKENNNNVWSGWLEKEQIKNYNLQDPAIMVGLRIEANSNIKVLVNQTTVNADYPGIKVKLNLPKLVKLPLNEAQLIEQYNRLNIFGGNTFELELTNPAQGFNLVVQALIDASATADSRAEYEALKNNGNLILKFKLGTSDWLEAEQLKNFLATQNTIDQSSNALKMKVELGAAAADQFVLDPTLAAKEFDLLPNNNTVIKKWLHGITYENALKAAGAIIPKGNKTALTYTFSKPLEPFAAANTFPDGLTLEYQLNGAGAWTKGVLPTSVDSGINTIKVRIAKRANENLYLYGPEEKQRQSEASIDLSQIPVLVTIDKNWFNEIPITTAIIQLENLTANLLGQWEEKIWQKANLTPEIRNKVTIKYSFLTGADRANLDKTNLAAKLIAEQSKYNDPTHHGIIKLQDPNDARQNGIAVQATFTKVNPQDKNVQFVDQSGNYINDNETGKTTGIANTQNIQTTLNLTSYINYLKTNPTNVTTTAAGAGTIAPNGLVPPVLDSPTNNVLFANQPFRTIEQWLKAAGLEFLWSIDGQEPWNTTANTRNYDPQTGQLFLGLQNTSTNLKAQLETNLTVEPNTNSFTSPIAIELNAPKIINVHPVDAADLAGAFSGNTKYLNVDTGQIQAKINSLLNRQGPQFANAPLTLLVQVGQENFVDYKVLAQTLKNKTTDVANGLVTVKFALDEQQNSANQWQIVTGGEDELTLINDNGTIKIFINDQGILQDLQTKTKLEGPNNTNFRFLWPNGWQVNADGVLNAGAKGKGLRLEFSFADLPQERAAGTNIETDWVKTPPSSYPLNKKQLYIRLQTQPNYVYEKIESNQANTEIRPPRQTYKFSLALNLPQSITVDRAWLNQPFSTNNIDLKQIRPQDFDQYENQVKQQINFSNDIKAKISIAYIFDGQNNALLTKEQLIAKFADYQNQTTDLNKNFGLLKLWNGTAGIKISSTFVKSDLNDPSYNLNWSNNQSDPVEINTEKVQSTIDLTRVAQWLETIKVQFNPGDQENSIASLNFEQEPVIAAGTPFNAKTWAQVEQVLENLNIQVEYLPVFANSDQNDWKQSANEIKQYDNQGIFKVRFKLEANKAKNLILKVKSGAPDLVGATTDIASDPLQVQLKIVRKIIIQQQTVTNNFINNNQAIQGNTKFLQIDQAIENSLIQAIETDNNQTLPPGSQPVFTNTNLSILYALGDSTTWKNRTDFINDLKRAGVNDQASNLIKFKFVVNTPQDQEVQFSVDPNNEYQFNPADNQGQKIKFFVHTANWETQANSISVSGTTNALNWNFATFGNGKFEENNNQVYLKTAAGNLLQLHFTTNPQATYNDVTIGNPNELATKWIKEKPTTINPTEQLFVRISPIHSGVVYEAAGDATNGIAQTAQVHSVQLTITQVIKVKKEWFTSISLTANEIEIKNFNVQLLNQWIGRLKNEIKTLNQLPNGSTTDQLLSKINLQFSIDNQGQYDAQGLVEAIVAKLNNYNGNDLGIVQLWSPQNQRGLKIGVKFISTDQQGLALEEVNSQNLNQDTVLDTTKIYTLVDLTTYVNVLTTKKTTVTPKGNGRPEEIDAFMPPDGEDATGFLNAKSYDQIAQRLNQTGITIEFAQEIQNPQWQDKNQIKQYNPRINKLFLRFTNAINNNLKLKINQLVVDKGQNSERTEIALPLAVPRQININITSDLANFAQLMNFGGNTKNITYSKNGAQSVIEQILRRNAVESQNDNTYLSAPLKVKFAIGDTAQYEAVTNDELKKFLASYPDDLTNREVRWKFDLDDADPQEWIFSPDATGLEGTLIADDNRSPIKIYINDKNIFNDLQNPSLKGSTSEQLLLDWSARKIQVDAQNGIINATEINDATKVRGFGLRIEFSYLKGLTGAPTEAENQDPFKGWSRMVPKSFDVNVSTELAVRVRLVDDNKYFYDQINTKFTIDLSQIPTVIKLDGNWLQKPFSTQPIMIENLSQQDFQNYEDQVWQAAQLGPVDRARVKISYHFDNQDYLDLQSLVNAIRNYQNQHSTEANFGFLQLWNTHQGQKITTKFVKLNEQDDQYSLEIKNTNSYDLDFSQVITTIDFSPVLAWLKNLEVPIEEGNAANQIVSLRIPPVQADGTAFNNKEWNAVNDALKAFGLTIEYSNNIKNQNPDWGLITNVNQYDPTSPSFRIRFRTDGQNSVNMQLKLNATETLNGQNASQSSEQIIQIKARLLVQISPQLLSEFQTKAIFAGNTKNLDITRVINPADELLGKIIEANLVNDPRYDKLNDLLEIQYILQKNQPDAAANWQDLNGLVKFLENQNNDQNTNQIWYRIRLKDATEFNLSTQDARPIILNPHQEPTVANINVKYYINEAQWETKASQIAINGTSDALEWNLTTIFGSSLIEENQRVYLQNAAGRALQIYFTLNPQANYDTPLGLSNNLAEITTKWVSIKPTQIRPGEQNLKIKLVPMAGFVYGPADVNPKRARAHNVQINVQNVLYVNKDWFNTELVLNQIELSALKPTNFNAWEEKIYQQIKLLNQINDQTIAKKVKIRYFFENRKFNNFQALLAEIERLNGNYRDQQSLGIVQLWNEISQRGSKIEAVFELEAADQANYVLKTPNNPNPNPNDLQGLVKTNQIYTSISLVSYINVLKNQKTTVEPNLAGNPGDINSFTPPQMPGDLGSAFLSGYTFEQISNRLAELGVLVKFAKTASTVDREWLNKNQISSYDIQTGALFLSFEVAANAQNAKVQWSSTDTLEPGDNMRGPRAIKLALDVPKYILIDPAANFWLTNKEDFDFRGNTKFIQFNKAKIEEFVAQILNANAVAANDTSFNNAPLKIEFQVGQTAFTEINSLQNYLQNEVLDDLTERGIRFKFSIPNQAAQEWKLLAPETEYTLLTEADVEIQKLKIYIHDKGIFSDIRDKTKLSGTSQQLQWEFWNDLRVDPNNGVLSAQNRGHGLKVEFTFNTLIADNGPTGLDVNQDWVGKMPTSFRPDQNQVLLRLNVVNSNLYEYEMSNQRITLDLNAIIVILNLQSSWLKELVLSGNTKDLVIDDNRAQMQLRAALPANQPDLVKIKYTIDGQNWYEKAALIELLLNQEGQKDAANFILKRNEIQARFELDLNQIQRFQMLVDNQLVDANNNNSPRVHLIDDQANPPLNTNVQGYIELKHLKHFLAQNFAIQGTDTRPQLIISKKAELETLMQVYATDNLFDILITSQQSPDGQWDFNNAISLLTADNRFISNEQLIANGFALGANKKVALRFKAKDPKYDVYYNGAKQANGYDLDISQNVRVTFEIENPFSKNQKTLALWWTADKSKTQGKYNQGQGGFKVVNGDQNGNPDLRDYQSALDWLNSNQSGLSAKEQEVLELVYYVYDGEPNQATIAEVEKEITNYDFQWKKLSEVLNNDQSGFTNPLNLKVGQYVSVALRVKQQYATGNDVYTLKNNQHSFINPIQSANGQAQLGRAHGYIVQTDAVAVESKQIVLENMLDSEQLPLDGYTNIKRLGLVKDSNENYQGVNLELQLFHEFYRGENGEEVLITPFDKIKLIKRDAQSANQDQPSYFKDANGGQIKDDQGQPIPILVDAQGKPTAPIKSQTALKKSFTDYGDGFFGITVNQNDADRDKWGIFKNESIQVVLGAKLGIGGVSDPDFILDQEKNIDLQKEISSQIKFPIFNQDNIRYSFNHDDFRRGNIQFVNANQPDQAPSDGKSKVATLIELTKQTATNEQPEVIKGTDEADALNKLNQELQTSFNGKLAFETIYEEVSGARRVYNKLELYNLKQLKNGDRIKVNIVSADDDFIWARPPKTLAIQVNGLTTRAPNRDKLQFLRVEQNGKVDGKGSFKVLVNDPNDLNSNAKDILDGWKFVLRVWNSDKTIKHNWTADQERINDLQNGDKVEWKLLDEFDNPVEDAYYNTVAANHQLDLQTGQTIFQFNQVNYPEGLASASVVHKGIGAYPKTDNEYPENSGFVVSGLENELQALEIDETIFAKILAQLEPRYVGFNGQGSINFNEEYLKKNYYINQAGELYEKPLGLPTFKQQVAPENKEISLAEFLANTTFYTSDPNLINYQNGFKFIGNDTNLNNHLSCLLYTSDATDEHRDV